MSESIALFAKAAIPGKVKTRLTPYLTPEEAADFHAACVKDVWRTAVKIVRDGVRFYTDEPYEPWINLAGADRLRYQEGDNLGQRMLRCFEELSQEGFKRMLIIGADSPQVPVEHLREGLDLLMTEKDAVLGMSADGGYYAVGCRKPRRMMFHQVEWSRATTYAQTRAAFEFAGLRLKSGMYAHYDVDTAEDLERLRGEARLGSHVRAWFNAHPRRS